MTIAVLAELDEVLKSSPDFGYRFKDELSAMNPKRAMLFLAGRALLQLCLEHFAGVKSLPMMAKGAHGKPVFLAQDDLGLDFNISHSGNFIALCLGQGRQGVDLELSKPRKLFNGLKDRILSEEERQYLNGMDALGRGKTFSSLWTIRESLLKASGYGLSDLKKIQVYFKKRLVHYSRLGAEGKIVTLKPLPSVKDGALSLSIYLQTSDQLACYCFGDDRFLMQNWQSEFCFNLI